MGRCPRVFLPSAATAAARDRATGHWPAQATHNIFHPLLFMSVQRPHHSSVQSGLAHSFDALTVRAVVSEARTPSPPSFSNAARAIAYTVSE